MSEEFWKVLIPALLVSAPVFYTTWANRKQSALVEDRLKEESLRIAAERKKFGADYASQIADSALDLITPYHKEIEQFTTRVARLEKLLAEQKTIVVSSHVKIQEYETQLNQQEEIYERRLLEYEQKIEQLTARVARYERAVEVQSRTIYELEQKVRRYRAGVVSLTNQMKDAGIEPVFVFKELEAKSGETNS